MALAYPEGECFFMRNGLRSNSNGGYNADNPIHFHNFMLVDYLWNVPADSGDANTGHPTGHSHPRSGYVWGRQGPLQQRHGNWNALPFSYGLSEQGIRRREQHELCTTIRSFHDYYRNGASAEVCDCSQTKSLLPI